MGHVVFDRVGYGGRTPHDLCKKCRYVKYQYLYSYALLEMEMEPSKYTTHLFGNATNIDTGTSKSIFFDAQNFLGVGGRSFGTGYAAGAAADDY